MKWHTKGFVIPRLPKKENIILKYSSNTPLAPH